MKVKATKRGFYNNRRVKPGQVFHLKGVKDGKGKKSYPDFSKKWMTEDIDKKLEEDKPVKKFVNGIPVTEDEMSKVDEADFDSEVI